MNGGTTSLDCQMWIGDACRNPPTAIVAIKTSSGGSAVCASEATEGATCKAERLEARPSAATRKVIAVLDDDQDLTNTICAHLEESSGYDARPFYKTADLLSSAKVQRFDGYVIDWIVGETSTLKLIAGLRAQDAICPIVVLTAQMLSGLVDEADFAAAVKNFHLVFSEKPVRMSILSATLARAFAAGAARSRRLIRSAYASLPWQCLYFLPLPHGQGSLRPTFGTLATRRRTDARRHRAERRLGRGGSFLRNAAVFVRMRVGDVADVLGPLLDRLGRPRHFLFRLHAHRHQDARHIHLHDVEQLREQLEGLALVFLLRVLLRVATQVDALAQIVERGQVLAPVLVDATAAGSCA